MPFNSQKLQDHLSSMEAAAKLMLKEADKIRSMIGATDVKEKPQKMDKMVLFKKKFDRRKELSLARRQGKS